MVKIVFRSFIKMILEGRHKFGFLIGEILCPTQGDPQE